MATNNNNNKQLDIELSAEIASGIYSNLQIVTHSPTEVIIDFVQVMPAMPKAQVKSRVILNPQHAKRLLYALKDNLDKYEMQHGAIKDMEQGVQYEQINPIGQA
ncbi:MAG: DUF3467 domain-containing protein [Bacteroidales bacterium]|jgi:hypothetical protein|nr:DUF3467 domain-containing protein [Bacteroidales bacterium]